MTAAPFPDTHFHSAAAAAATLGDEHATTFQAPPKTSSHVTPGVNLPRYYAATRRLFLSPLLYFLPSRRSLSGFSRVSLCLYLPVHLLRSRSPETDAIVTAASVIKAMRGNQPPHPLSPPPPSPPPADFQ